MIERYYPKLTLDFETNKRICDEIAIIASKRLRNKVCIHLLGVARESGETIEEEPCDAREIEAGKKFVLIAMVIDCRIHHPFDEAYPAWTRPWYLLQAARRGNSNR